MGLEYGPPFVAGVIRGLFDLLAFLTILSWNKLKLGSVVWR